MQHDTTVSAGTTSGGRPEPSLEDLLLVLWRRLWLILLVPLLCAGAALGYSFSQMPVYESSVMLLVRQEQQEGATPGDLAGEMEGLQQVTQTVVVAAETRPVAAAVIDELGLGTSPERFLQNMSVEQVTATQFIEVSYQDTDPQRAQQVVSTVGTVLSESISEQSPTANNIVVSLWEGAEVPDEPESPNPLRNLVVAVVFGGMFGLGLAFLLEYFAGRRSKGSRRTSEKARPK